MYLTNVNVGVCQLPSHGCLLEIEGVEFFVDITKQVRLDQHLADDAEQSYEAHGGTNCNR